MADIDAMWNQWWVMEPGTERTALTAEIRALHESGSSVAVTDDDSGDGD